MIIRAQRPAALLAAAALSVSTLATVPAATAVEQAPAAVVTDAVNPAANSQVVQNATMNWGLKKSFRDYLAKPAVGSRIETTNGLARNADGTFKWSAGTGTYQNGSGTINFPGTLHITGHHGKLDMTFTNVRLQLNGREGKLILDGSSLDMQGNNHVFKDTEFATVDTSSVRVNGSTLTLNNAAVTLTPAGAQAFSGFYNKAEEYRFDPLTVNAGLRGTHAVFSDVPEGAAFYAEIQWFAQQKITTGYPDGTFRPQGNVERGAMAAFFYRMAGSPKYTAPATSKFSDVPTTHPFYKEISWMRDQGITTGYPDGTFRPNAPVNRDAMAAFFYRAAGSPAYLAPAQSPFADVSTNNQFYREIAWLADRKISTGWPDKTYRPGNAINRDAMAAFIYRYKHLNR